MASTHLYRATDATSGSGYTSTFTWSAWVKRSKLGEQGLCMNKRADGATNSRWRFYFGSDDTLNFEIKDSGGSDDAYLRTKRKFRDTSGWFHLVLVYDTTAAENDRVKMYVNGLSMETNGGWDEADRASSGFGSLWSSASEHYVGKMVNNSNTSFYFDGLMSHIHCAYGTAYQASTFGETDSTTGEWKIIVDPTVTYGSQGYFILKDGNSTTDQSGEGNNMSVDAGTLTNTEDNPSNVMNSFNAVATYKDNFNPSNWLKNGNTVIDTDGRTDFRWFTDFGNLGATSGKYYMELKINQIGSVSTVDYGGIGIANDFAMSDASQGTYGREVNDWGSGVYAYSFRFDSRNAASIALVKREDGSSTQTSSYQTQSSNLQVVMMAWDLDNGKIWFGRENSWFDSGNPSNGTNPALTFTPNGRTFLPYVTHWVHNSGNNPIYSINFGNGYFGTSTVASAGNNASGNGIFEYDTPTGFTALSTKGLNE